MDIYQEVLRDHREIKSMLRELVGVDKNDEYRFILIAEIRNAMVAHGRTEEAVLYHTLRRGGNSCANSALRGVKEHIEIESLLLLLQAIDRVGGNWKPMARKLKDVVDKHLQEEELRLFELCRKIFTHAEALKMGRVYRGLKPALEQRGELRSTFEMMLNLLPPKILGSFLPVKN